MLALALALLAIAACSDLRPPTEPAAGPPLDLGDAPGADSALPAGLTTTPVYVQDLSGCAVGAQPADAIDNSAWAGGAVTLKTVATGDPRRPLVVECLGSNYCQIAFGDFALKKGRIYRTSLDVAVPGGATIDVLLRILPGPWTSMVASKEQVRDDFRTISFLGRSADDVKNVCVMLINPGSVNLRVANIRVEEVAGEVVLEAPPVAGNLLLNSSFELAGDGWFVRAWGSPSRPQHLLADDAGDGRRVVELYDKNAISSTWMKLSFQAEYLVRARARVTGAPGKFALSLVGNAAGWRSQAVELKQEDGWQTVSFTVRPEPVAEGKLQRFLNAFVVLTANGGPVQADAVEVAAILPAGATPAAYQPCAPLEFGIAIDPVIPMGVAPAGTPVPLRILASADVSEARLLILDEQRRLLREQRLAFTGRTADVVLADLPPGYLMLRTAPLATVTAPGRIEGESFLCVVPAMPDVALGDWLYGTHVIDYPPLRQACWKLGWHWDRLHDMGSTTKWATVQPKGGEDWVFEDDIVAARRLPGFGLFGNLESLPAWVPRAEQPKVPAWGCQFPVFTDATLAPWTDYVRRVSRHFAGRIDGFEVGNEPHITGTTAAQYVKVLKATYPAIKAGNPAATVVGLGGMIVGDPLIAECLKLGAGAFCDAISIHGYNLTTWATVDGPERLQAAVRELRGLLKAAGADEHLPIWDTESGTASPWSYSKFYSGAEGGQDGALEVARMFPKSVAGIKAAGLARWFFYFANDDNFAADTNHFRICSVNDTMRMPMQPMAVAIATLEGRRYVRREPADAAPGVVHLLFSGRGETVHMLWTTSGTRPVPCPAGTTRAMNMWGRGLAVHAGSLELSPSPIYAFTP